MRREGRLGVADLNAEQRATGGASELLEPPGEERAVAIPVAEILVAFARLRGKAVDEARIDEERVDRGICERGFLADDDAEIGQIRPASRRVAGDDAAAHEHHRFASGKPDISDTSDLRTPRLAVPSPSM